MTNENQRDPKRELQDRLVDFALRETVGNQTPPAANSSLSGPTPPAVTAANRADDARSGRRYRYMIAASSAACIAIVVLLAIGNVSPPAADRVVVIDESGSIRDSRISKSSPFSVYLGFNGDGVNAQQELLDRARGGNGEFLSDADELAANASPGEANGGFPSHLTLSNRFASDESIDLGERNEPVELRADMNRPMFSTDPVRRESALEGAAQGQHPFGGEDNIWFGYRQHDMNGRGRLGATSDFDTDGTPSSGLDSSRSDFLYFLDSQRTPALTTEAPVRIADVPEPAAPVQLDAFGPPEGSLVIEGLATRLTPGDSDGEKEEQDKVRSTFTDLADIDQLRDQLETGKDSRLSSMLPLAVDARRKQAEQFRAYHDETNRDIADLKLAIQSPTTGVDTAQLTRQLQQLENAKDQFQNVRKQLEDEIQSLDKLVTELDAKAATTPGNTRIAGAVTSVGGLDAIEVQVAGDEEAVVGQGLDLYTGNEYWGRIAVKEVTEGKVIGQVVSKVDGRPLPVGAKATGNLKKSLATKKTWRRAKAGPNASRLMVGDRDELPPQGVQANVMIDGFRARVVLDYYFYNDRDQSLEGAFKVRLPNDASLFYFAFGETRHEYQPNIDSLVSAGAIDAKKMKSSEFDAAGILAIRSESLSSVKEARIVPREKAAYAYQDMTRKQIDPALVEWSGAGMFNARVFPLAAGKLHRIVVGYDVNLSHDNGDLVYQLDLPTDMGELHVDLNVASGPQWKPAIKPATDATSLNGRSYYYLKDPAGEQIELRFSKPGATLLTGADQETGSFFAFEATPTFPADEQRAGASHGLFLVDTSLSNDAERFNRHLDLMIAVLDSNREQLTHFNTLFFNVETHWWKSEYIANTPANVAELRRICNSLALEGATDLRAALQAAAKPAWLKDDAPRADLFLLSDGAATWGETNLHLIGKELQSPTVGGLFAYKTSIAGEASDALLHLSRLTGGALFSIANEEEIATAATAHRNRPWQLDSVAMAGGSDLLIAGRPEVIYPGQRLLVVGRGEPKLDAELLLSVHRGDEKKSIRLPIDQVVKSDLAPRVYGQIAVGQLEDWMPATRTFSEAYARHFRVAGQSCSLLMLETEEDYLKYDIKPEEDAFVVKSTPADALIEKTIADLGSELEDPKVATLQLLKRLGNVPGFQLELPAALQIAIDQMPAESFVVSPQPLECELRVKAAISDAYVALLTKQRTELPYDEVVAEAKRRFGVYGAGDGLKTLSSLIENNPGDVVLLRDVGYSAMQWQRGDQAVALLKRAAVARPFEPQGWLALAQSLADMERADLAIVYYELVLAGRWDGRFGEVHRIAAVDYLRFLKQIEAKEIDCSVTDFAHSRMVTLGKTFDMQGTDLLVTLAWNTDRTDVDLHVLEPTGEKCSYDNTDTKIGGHITSDVTAGYGPEMYSLKNAKHGDYEISIHYFGSDRTRVSTRSKVTISVYRNFGEPNEQVFRETVSLSDQDQTIVVKKVRIEK